MNLCEELKNRYADGSKHANYQNLPEFVKQEIDFDVNIDESWRGDTARYRYISARLALKEGEVIGDIGANTGFFTLSLARRQPGARFLAYEINPRHVEFIHLVKRHFGMSNVEVREKGVSLDAIDTLERHDLLLNFNVLHHAGVDFDQGMIASPDRFMDYAVRYLAALGRKTSSMLFQMGYNWGGDKTRPIVELQDDWAKMLFSVRCFLQSGWQVDTIALCRKTTSGREYVDVPEQLRAAVLEQAQGLTAPDPQQAAALLAPYDLPHLSEFYRRPLFGVSSGRVGQ